MKVNTLHGEDLQLVFVMPALIWSVPEDSESETNERSRVNDKFSVNVGRERV